MAITGINPNDTKTFICESDRDSESPTEWELRPLNAQAGSNALDQVGSRGDIAGALLHNLLVYGLRGASNFLDDDGAEIVFRTNHKPRQALGVTVKNPVSETFLDRIPLQVKQELALEVLSISQLQDDDAKN